MSRRRNSLRISGSDDPFAKKDVQPAALKPRNYLGTFN